MVKMMWVHGRSRSAGGRWSLAGLAGLTAVLAAAPLAGQSPRLVAPVYPGAVPAGEPGVYLSADSPEQVRAFYEARLGPGTLDRGRTMRTLGLGLYPDSGQIYWAVVSFDEARAITGEPLNENMQTSAAGVVIAGPLPPVRRPPASELGSLRAVGDYFGQLEHLTRVGTLERGDVDPVYERYLPLARMHFRLVETEDRMRPLHEVQPYRCREQAMGGRMLGDIQASGEDDLEAMAARLAELYAAGKVAEAIALQQKITEQSMARGLAKSNAASGEDAIPTVSSAQMLELLDRCLAELEAEGYRTRIKISTHPAEWQLDRWWDRRDP
jgi:hypothetical protein